MRYYHITTTTLNADTHNSCCCIHQNIMPKPRKQASVVTTIDKPPRNESERRRVVYVLVFMQTKSESAAKMASGLGKSAHARIVEMLRARGSLADAPRSGRAVEFTGAVMDKAYNMLAEDTEGFLTGHVLLEKLKRQGVIQSSADVDKFMYHLREYVESKGHKLIVNSTKTIFFITLKDVVKRVKFASSLLAELQQVPLAMLIFSDETTLEESPHPKGRCRTQTMQGCELISDALYAASRAVSHAQVLA